MRKSASNCDPLQLDDIDEHLTQSYVRLVNMAHENGEVTTNMRDRLLALNHDDIDELDECFLDLIEAIRHKDRYRIMERIEKGEQLLAVEPDEVKREQYRKVLKQLCEDLDRLMAKGA